MSTEKEVNELVQLLLSQPQDSNIIEAHTQNFGTISLLFVYSMEFEDREFCVFAELDKEEILLDETGHLHLILLELDSARVLKSVDDIELLQRLLDELYCRLLIEMEEANELEDDAAPVLDIQAASRRANSLISYEPAAESRDFIGSLDENEVDGEVSDELRSMLAGGRVGDDEEIAKESNSSYGDNSADSVHRDIDPDDYL